MKKIIPQRIHDLWIWEKIKLLNRESNRKKVIAEWNNGGKQGFTPHVIKQEAIKFFKNKFRIETLVETGTFMGEMIYAQRNNFQQIISIELSEELCKAAQKRLTKYSNVNIFCGDSGKLLKKIISSISEPALFWLDGHYSGFETAKGNLETPVLAELDAILTSWIDHIVLVDDARLFIGKNDYPTIDELKKYVMSKKGYYTITVEDDIIRIHPLQ